MTPRDARPRHSLRSLCSLQEPVHPNRVLVGFVGGFWRALVDFGGLRRVLSGLSGFIGFYLVLSGFIRFYRVLSGFTGFCPVLPGFVLPLFTEPPQLAATAALLLIPAMAAFRYKQASKINSFFQPREPSSIVEGSLVPADVARKKVMWHEILQKSYGSRCNWKGGTQRDSPRARRPPTRSRRGKMLAIDRGRRRARVCRRGPS